MTTRRGTMEDKVKGWTGLIDEYRRLFNDAMAMLNKSEQRLAISVSINVGLATGILALVLFELWR
jgi:hypothetical protein